VRLLEITARWELIILIASFGVVTLWRLFKSASFAGLVRSSDGSLSPGRIQLLTLTVLTALQYLLTTLRDPSHLHALPSGIVAAMGGSQMLYLGAKAWSTFGPKRNNSEEQ
jgi:hypothetical protein